MDNPLKNLELEGWYKVSIVISFSILILALTVELQGVDNNTVQLISLGGLFISLGEWVNHPLQTSLHQPSAYMPHGGTTTGHPRNNRPIGIFFDILGICLVIWGIFI